MYQHRNSQHIDVPKISDLRVAFLSDALQDRNGVGTYYQDLVEHLGDYVARAELFCPKEHYTTGYEGFFSFSLPGDPTQKVYVPSITKLTKKVKHIAPHIIILPTPGPYGLLGLGLTKHMKVRLCAGYHTQYDKLADIYWHPMFSSIGRSYLSWLNNLLFRSSSVVVTNSGDMVAAAQEAGAHEVILIGTPIAKHFLTTPVAPRSPELRTVLYAGRLAPEKNIDTIMHAVKRLPHIRFVIAGDGPLREYVEEHVRQFPNLEYIGWLSRKKVMSVIDATDMLILPSTVESFGTIALEAMARRRLVLISPNCGILNWSSLAQGIFCLQNGETLSDAIQRIAGLAGEIREKKAETAYEAAKAFNTKTLTQWLEVFHRIMSHTPDA